MRPLKIEEVFSHEKMKAFASLMYNLHEYSLVNEIPKDVEEFLTNPNIKSFMDVSKHINPITQDSDEKLSSFISDTLVRNSLNKIQKGKMNDDINYYVTKRFKLQFKTQMKKAVNLAVKKSFIDMGLGLPRPNNTDNSGSTPTDTTDDNSQTNETNNSGNTTKSVSSRSAFKAPYRRFDAAVDTKVQDQNSNEMQSKIEKIQNKQNNATKNVYFSNKNCINNTESNSCNPLNCVEEEQIEALFKNFLPHDERKEDALIFSEINLRSFDINFDINYKDMKSMILETFEKSEKFKIIKDSVSAGKISVENFPMFPVRKTRNTENVVRKNQMIKKDAAKILNDIRIENATKKYFAKFGTPYQEDFSTSEIYLNRIEEKLTLELAKKISGMLDEPENYDNETIWSSATSKISSLMVYDYEDYAMPSLMMKNFVSEVQNGSLFDEFSNVTLDEVFSQFSLIREIEEYTTEDIVEPRLRQPEDEKKLIDIEINQLLRSYGSFMPTISESYMKLSGGEAPP